MSLPASVVAFKKTVLDPKHVTTYNALSASPATTAAIAAAEGNSDQGVVMRKLSLLVDEGLATQPRASLNAPTPTTFQLS